MPKFLLFQAYARSWGGKDERHREQNLARRVASDKAITEMNLIKALEGVGRKNTGNENRGQIGVSRIKGGWLGEKQPMSRARKEHSAQQVHRTKVRSLWPQLKEQMI